MLHPHKLSIQVILSDREEEKLKAMIEGKTDEIGNPLTADRMLMKMIEKAVTEELKEDKEDKEEKENEG